MVEKLTTIEIIHVNDLDIEDYNYLTKLINDGYTSGIPLGTNITSWKIKKIDILTIEYILKLFIDSYSDELDKLKIIDASSKADYFKSKLIENYFDDFKNENISIEFDSDWNCGDEDVDKAYGEIFHTIIDGFSSLALDHFDPEMDPPTGP